MDKECSIEGCRKPVEARGLCIAHYERLRRHGDPLAGRTFEGEPKRFLREVVLCFDGDECLKWPYKCTKDGYGQIKRNGKHVTVSRLVCEKRHGPPPSPEHQSAHSCGKGHEGCVNPRHLRWATSKQNQADKLIHGTHNRGEKSCMAKLTESDVHQIRAMKGQALQRKIALQFGVSRTQISAIQHYEKWSWLR